LRTRIKRIERKKIKKADKQDKIIDISSEETDGKFAFRPQKYKNFKQKIFDVWNPSRINTELLIMMELIAGGFTFFFINADYKGRFEYKGGEYIIDPTLKEWCTTAKAYMLRYHQGCALPIRENIDIKKITDGTKQYYHSIGEDDITTLMNPFLLKKIIESDVIQAVLSGHELTEFFRKLKSWIMVIVILGVITVLLLLKMGGNLLG